VLGIVLSLASPLFGYSVLTHEAIIDSVWDANIKPLLLRRFPGATSEQLLLARANAYGGCIVQDMGYYPFGSKLFSDLVHYVRSGDFVAAMLDQAQGIEEYAFALGALAHYAADNLGHPLAVNLAVPIEYPKLKAKFGNRVTYADSPAAHIKTEFGFDVLQVSEGNYAPKAYHDFIGFQVPKSLLERSFLATYSLKLSDVFQSVDLAIGTYRFTVGKLIPDATRVAWQMKKEELLRVHPGLSRNLFVYNLSRAGYEKEWGDEYRRPGIGVRILAILFRLIPKIGPFKGVDLKPPTSETARLFVQSFDRTVEVYRKFLADIRTGRLVLINRDLDTGKPTMPGEYHRADKTYAKLATMLVKEEHVSVDPKLRENILAFYSKAGVPVEAERKDKEWRKALQAVSKLREQAPQ